MVEQGWQYYRVAQGILLAADGEAMLLVGNRMAGGAALMWTLPGGRAEAGEDIAAALVREFEEETGLRVAAVGLAYVAEARSKVARKIYLTCAFRVRLVDADEVVVQGVDPMGVVAVARFVPIAELRQYIPSSSLGQPVAEYLADPTAGVRYWLFPEYMEDGEFLRVLRKTANGLGSREKWIWGGDIDDCNVCMCAAAGRVEAAPIGINLRIVVAIYGGSGGVPSC